MRPGAKLSDVCMRNCGVWKRAIRLLEKEAPKQSQEGDGKKAREEKCARKRTAEIAAKDHFAQKRPSRDSVALG